MEHFSIIQAICRAAMANPTEALLRQLERLQEVLTAEGQLKEAKAIEGVLKGASRATEMAPSKLTKSKLVLQGEELSSQTQVPVDRESSAALLEVLFPSQLPESPPLFSGTEWDAVLTVLEEWSHFERLEDFDVSPSKTCLIYGPPGTGKTTLAMWIARQLNIPVVVAKLDGLVSSFLGTTSRNIGTLFSFANRYRCMLLLDEFDALAKVRDDPQEVGEIKRVVNTVLQNLDSRRLIGLTMAITNHEKLLDSAIWRRFEIQLEVPKPSFEVRVQIVKRYVEPVPLQEQKVRLIAWMLDGTSGAEVESVVRSLKKALAISSTLDLDFSETLTKLSVLNSARISEAKRKVLALEPIARAKVLLADSDLGFDQSDIAVLFGKDKATISRWIKGASRRKN